MKQIQELIGEADYICFNFRLSRKEKLLKLRLLASKLSTLIRELEENVKDKDKEERSWYS